MLRRIDLLAGASLVLALVAAGAATAQTEGQVAQTTADEVQALGALESADPGSAPEIAAPATPVDSQP